MLAHHSYHLYLIKRIKVRTFIYLFCLFHLFSLPLIAAVGQVIDADGSSYLIRNFKKIKLNPGQSLEMKDNIYSKAGKVTLKMSDASVINLAAGSHFKVKTYTTQGKSPTRSVLLFKGESRFKVTPSSTKEESFTVRTPTAVAGVRGTDFNVSLDSAETTVTVFEGSVACYSVSDIGQTGIAEVLNEGFQSKIAKGKSPSKATKVPQSKLQKLKGSTTKGGSKEGPKAESENSTPESSEPIDTNANIEESIQSDIQKTLGDIPEKAIEQARTDTSVFDDFLPINVPPDDKKEL